MRAAVSQGFILKNDRKTINAWAMYFKMIPKTENNAGYFSFYDVSEKVAMMCGLILFGTLDNLTGSMRNPIFALGLWFAIGLFLLWRGQRINKLI